MTKAELARKAGVDKSNITRWTDPQNRWPMMPASLERVVKALRITMREYFGWTGKRRRRVVPAPLPIPDPPTHGEP